MFEKRIPPTTANRATETTTAVHISNWSWCDPAAMALLPVEFMKPMCFSFLHYCPVLEKLRKVEDISRGNHTLLSDYSRSFQVSSRIALRRHPSLGVPVTRKILPHPAHLSLRGSTDLSNSFREDADGKDLRDRFPQRLQCQ